MSCHFEQITKMLELGRGGCTWITPPPPPHPPPGCTPLCCWIYASKMQLQLLPSLWAFAQGAPGPTCHPGVQVPRSQSVCQLCSPTHLLLEGLRSGENHCVNTFTIVSHHVPVFVQHKLNVCCSKPNPTPFSSVDPFDLYRLYKNPTGDNSGDGRDVENKLKVHLYCWQPFIPLGCNWWPIFF